MAKPKSKRILAKKWNEKIIEAKKVYNKVRKENKGLPGWKNSPSYKDIEKRKKRSLKRAENAKEINARRREVYAARKESEAQKDNFVHTSEVSVFEAYSGNGRIFENNIRQIVKDRNATFYGEIFIDNKKDSSFTDVQRYSFKINAILSKIYNASSNKKSLTALSWRVKRSYFYDVEKNHLFVSHEFFSPSYQHAKL